MFEFHIAIGASPDQILIFIAHTIGFKLSFRILAFLASFRLIDFTDFRWGGFWRISVIILDDNSSIFDMVVNFEDFKSLFDNCHVEMAAKRNQILTYDALKIEPTTVVKHY